MANEIIMPKLGVDMQEGEILEWKFSEGDVVNEGDILLEIMSDKTNMEIEAENSGVLLKIVHPAGDVVPVTEVIGYIGSVGENVNDLVGEGQAEQLEPVQEASADFSQPSDAPAIFQKGKIRATPAARKLAKERGIALDSISGTGENGRIHKDDVAKFAKVRVTPLARKIAADMGLELSGIAGTGASGKITKDDVLAKAGADKSESSDMQLIETGKKIIRRRKQFVDELREIVSDIHYRISGGKEELFLKYEPNIDDIFFEDELSRAKEKDKKLCQTSVGPHRDDLLFSIGDVDIRKYGSQGQQRTSALSLKLSEIELVRKSISDTPVLLLDDVLSELDSSRQNYLLNNISDTQTIITCTGLDEFVRNRFTVNRVFEVIAGHVYERSI